MRTHRTRPTPAVLIASLSLMVSLGGTAYAAGGNALVLGAKNKAAKTTTLKVKGSGVALKLSSKGGPAASFVSGPGQPPFAVSSSTLVPGLNADRLDGLEAAAFRKTADPVDAATLGGLGQGSFRKTADPVDAATLGGLGPDAFRKTADPVDAATLDSLDSSSFLRSDTTPITASVAKAFATTQTAPNVTGLTLTADTEQYDPSNLHADAGGSTLTAPRTGTYVVSATVEWDANGTGYRRTTIGSPATGNVASVAGPALPSPAYTSQNVSGIVHLTAGQTVQVEVIQGSGGNLGVRLAQFQMAFVGP